MATFVQDSFTDTDGTALGSHVGEVGATWTPDSDAVGSDITIQGNGIVHPNGGIPWFHPSGLPSGSDYTITAPTTITNTTYTGAALLLRYNPATGSRYVVGIDGQGYSIQRRTSWFSGSDLAQVDATIGNGTNPVLVAKVQGSTISLSIDGGSTWLLNVIDPTPLTGTYVGVQYYEASPVRFDSFTATDLAPPPTFRPFFPARDLAGGLAE